MSALPIPIVYSSKMALHDFVTLDFVTVWSLFWHRHKIQSCLYPRTVTKQSQIQYVTELDTAKLQDLLNFVTILFCDLLDSVTA